MIHEGYRPFQPQGVRISLEKVDVRLSGRRPGERRLTVVRPPEPEPQKTLLQEMQQYITTRQSLRWHGYFFLMGKEPPNISLADSTYNDLHAIGIEDSLPDNSRAIMIKGNTARIEKVFVAYGMTKFSPEKQRGVLARWEEIRRLSLEGGNNMPITRLTPAETETVQWLLARIGVPFDAQPEGFKESYASLVFRMRTAAAKHQPQWEQEQKATGNISHFTRLYNSLCKWSEPEPLTTSRGGRDDHTTRTD